MPRVVIQPADESAETGFPEQPGVSAAGGLRTRGVVREPDRPIFLWLHELRPGARIALDGPPVGHCLYVLEGAVTACGQTVERDGAILVEHRGKAEVRAGEGGATIAHFHERPGKAAPPPRAGGRVHVAGPQGAYQAALAGGGGQLTVWADSSCPTCELWLHRSNLQGPRRQAQSHYHTDHEIILFLRGEMILGTNRMLKPRTALAIDAHTHYKFDTGPAGLSFINFRCTEPAYVQKQADGSHISYNEREFVKRSGNTPGTVVP